MVVRPYGPARTVTLRMPCTKTIEAAAIPCADITRIISRLERCLRHGSENRIFCGNARCLVASCAGCESRLSRGDWQQRLEMTSRQVAAIGRTHSSCRSGFSRTAEQFSCRSGFSWTTAKPNNFLWVRLQPNGGPNNSSVGPASAGRQRSRTISCGFGFSRTS